MKISILGTLQCSWTLLTLLVWVLGLGGVEGHSVGAPESRCDSMVPGHWVDGQTTPLPYHVELDKEVVEEGGRIGINLTTKGVDQDLDGFKGFLVQFKRPSSGGRDISPNNNVGSFDPIKSDLFQGQMVHCFGRRDSAITHRDPTKKKFVHVEWIAPEGGEGDDGEIYELRVTFVQNFWTVWPNQKKIVRVTKRKPLKRPVVINNTDQDKDKDKLSSPSTTSSTTTTTTTEESRVTFVDALPPPPNPNLKPQLRNADSDSDSTVGVDHDPHPQPELIIKNGSSMNNVEKDESSLDGNGSWDHLKQTWMRFLHYFGF